MKSLILISLIAFTFSYCNQKDNNQASSISEPVKLGAQTKIKADSLKSSEADLKKDFNGFWQTFRKAIIQADTAKLTEMTRFPLEQRGTFDDDPIIKVPKKDFNAVFFLFLKQWNGIDLAGSTEYDYIQKKTQINEEINDNQIRIGNMWFYLENEGWKLGFIYVNQETNEKLNTK
jgi:hypothetical protein